MTTQYTPTLKLALPVTGELGGTWGDVVNDNITSMIEQAITGLATINTWTANSHTLTSANGTTSESRCAVLVAATGSGGTALTGAGEIVCPAASKLYVLQNTTSYTVTLKTASGTGVAVATGETAFLFCDGTNVNACVTTIVNGHVTGNLTVDGNATVNGNTTLGNATSDTVTMTARVASSVLPSADNTYDLGSSANSWKDLYIDGTAAIATLNLTNALSVANGGTGQTSFTDGQLLIGNSTGNTLTKATLTAGSGVSITNGGGSISISATGLGGTVTSVSFTGGIVSVANPTTTPAMTIAGTSGGIPYFSSGSTWATSSALASNSLVVGGGAGGAPSSITTGTGVVTALGANVGAAGAFVVNGGALGTPSSGTLTNATGLPISTGVSGLGTNVATALGVNVGTSGAFVVNGGALGTPSSGTLTNATGLPVSTGVSGLGTGVATALAVSTGSAGSVVVNGGALGTPSSGTLTNATGLPLTTGVTGTLPVANGGTGITSFGTGVATALGTSVGTAGAFVVNGGALGTPSSGTLTNATGLPLTTGVTGTLPVANGGTGITSFGTGVATALGTNVGTAGAFVVNGGALGTPSSGTLTNATGLPISTGVSGLGTGVASALAATTNGTGGITTPNGTATLTNKRIDPRVSSTTSASSVTPDISAYDQYCFTALAATLTINAPTGTPVDGDKLMFRLLDSGSSQSLSWNATYTAIGVTLPTATTAGKMTYVGCIYNAANTRWDVVAVTTQA